MNKNVFIPHLYLAIFITTFYLYIVHRIVNNINFKFMYVSIYNYKIIIILIFMFILFISLMLAEYRKLLGNFGLSKNYD